MLNNLYLDLLKQFIAFKSISTDPSFKSELANTANWLAELFDKSGFVTQLLEGPNSNPVVYAHFDNKSEKTILIYGHYDVQPAEKKDGWNSDPFTVTEKDGKYIARGIVDNKGQVLIHISTVLQLINEGKLKYNIKFLIEGDEETGQGRDLLQHLKDYRELMTADYVIVSDGETMGNSPVLDSTLRGGFNLKLTFKTANTNLHSGMYGGAVPNAAYELSKFISGLYDESNKITIPNYYDKVDKVSDKDLKDGSELQANAEELLTHAEIKEMKSEENYDFFTQTGLRPTIQVTGITSGYTGKGFANIVPAQAEARLNFRIVASQKSAEVLEMFTNYVASTVPSYIAYTIKAEGLHEPVKVDQDSDMVRDITKKLEVAYGEKVVNKHVGGAIPFVASYKELYGIDPILVSMGNDDCNMHGVNENFRVDLIEKGLRFSRMMFEN